ncbi:MAG: tRNA pseudouridine(38-40) synthase TruA [Bacteroidetes bacterium]|nr:tRNA pseudouridine(38-40) synthase TruA [Bacteroidota bacterium]
MPRYFLEVAYKGTRYRGFQIQNNANTIQSEVERALQIIVGEKIELTGSSRTDAGVHAHQNFFHFDLSPVEKAGKIDSSKHLYKLNAVLPADIVVKNILKMPPAAHCRFDAISREYKYFIYRSKDPFLNDRAFYFPYRLNIDLMQEAAAIILEYKDFSSFSKRNTQVKTFICSVEKSQWLQSGNTVVYNITANRFLRGMVRGLVATMLKVGREKTTIKKFGEIIEARDCTLASFSAPAQGLFLISVNYPSGYFDGV